MIKKLNFIIQYIYCIYYIKMNKAACETSVCITPILCNKIEYNDIIKLFDEEYHDNLVELLLICININNTNEIKNLLFITLEYFIGKQFKLRELHTISLDVVKYLSDKSIEHIEVVPNLIILLNNNTLKFNINLMLYTNAIFSEYNKIDNVNLIEEPLEQLSNHMDRIRNIQENITNQVDIIKHFSSGKQYITK